MLAGAGSGKTRVLTFRIAHMIADLGVRPWQLLAITFTNKAAAEMRERLQALLPGGTRGMWVCTFHAMCVRMLREDADLLGYTGQFTIYDDDDSRRLVRDIMSAMEIDQKQYPINMIRSKISTAKNAMISPEEMAQRADDPRTDKAARVYAELERRLRAANAMDFDDLLVRALELLRTRPDYTYIYWSASATSAWTSIRTPTTCSTRSPTCWRPSIKISWLWATTTSPSTAGAVPTSPTSSISSRDFPNAKVVKLEQNYRSTGHILAAANAVVRHNSQRKDKRLFTDAGDGEKIQAYQASDERDEGRWIAAEIEKLHDAGTGYDDIAVFYRTNAQSRILEDMFLRAGVPYRIVGGTRFFDRAEIRDVMAYLKMIVNPADEMSVKRVINTPRRGIGSTSIAKIELLAQENRCSFFPSVRARVRRDEHVLGEGTKRPGRLREHRSRGTPHGRRTQGRCRGHRRQGGPRAGVPCGRHHGGGEPRREHPGILGRCRRVRGDARGHRGHARELGGTARRGPRRRSRPGRGRCRTRARCRAGQPARLPGRSAHIGPGGLGAAYLEQHHGRRPRRARARRDGRRRDRAHLWAACLRGASGAA